MIYCDIAFRKVFEAKDAESGKKAYMDACKWVANNIVSKGLDQSVLWRITKLRDRKVPAFALEVYASVDESVVNERHCKVCKEVYNMFYMKERRSCEACREQAYRARMQDSITVKVNYVKGEIRRFSLESKEGAKA